MCDNIDDTDLPEIPNIPISDDAVISIHETMSDIENVSDQCKIDMVDGFFDSAQLNESENPTTV